jgi:hypothetical protein
MLALSLPSAVQFIHLQAQSRPEPLNPLLAEALDFLDHETPPGSVCLAREGPAQATLVATRCRALALDVFPSSYLDPKEVDALTQAREVFWQRWRDDPPHLPDELISRFRVDYVLAELARDGRPALTPAGSSFVLEPLFANADFAVYRVRRNDL